MIRNAHEQRFEELFSNLNKNNVIQKTQEDIVKTLTGGDANDINALIEFFLSQPCKQSWFNKILHRLGFKRSIEYHWKEAKASMFVEKIGEFSYQMKFATYREDKDEFEEIADYYYIPVFKTTDIKTGKPKYTYVK